MPTRSVAGSGGVGAGRWSSRWHGTGGNRGRDSLALDVGSAEPAKARKSGIEDIERLPGNPVIFAFYSLVKYIIRFIFVLAAECLLSHALLQPKPCRVLSGPARYTRLQTKRFSQGAHVENVGVLIVDNDAASQAALSQVLGAEGWLVEGAISSSQALRELATGKWALVLANIAMTGITGALFVTLRELALPPENEEVKAHVRVLFIVPESAAAQATPLLEKEHLPYVLKPFTFHDLLERVSDLLMETDAIVAPLRKVRQEGLISSRRSRHGRNSGRDGNRNTGMFANREDYQMTEEEMAEYEQQEMQAMQKKKKKKLIPLD